MRGIPRWLMAPVMRAWVTVKELEFATTPKPSDEPIATSADVFGDRILVLGSGIALGLGVLTNDLALPGALARAHVAQSGRGATVRVIGESNLGPRNVIRRLGDVDLKNVDTVVLTLGLYRALRLGSLRAWTRDMTELMCELHEATRPGTRILVAGVHPIRSLALFDSFLGTVACNHGRAMNRVTKAICSDFERAEFVELTAPAQNDPMRHRSAVEFRHYAGILAAHTARTDARELH